ncbi:hypothetical protein cypCar_00010264 [Cyprinus carpio]|nr:hypothetical protein cypCar_00010264 [Cyprinus carpio]
MITENPVDITSVLMDESAELSVSVTQIVQRLKGTHLHSQLEKQAKECLHKPEIKLETLKDDVRRLLKASGMTWLSDVEFFFLNVGRENYKMQFIGNYTWTEERLEGTKVNWEKRILKSLNSMCTELGIPLARKRPVPEQKELTNKWNEMGTDEPDLSKFRPVYAPKDFLEREMYPELGLTYGQLGIDDHTHVPPDLFESEHIHIGKKVVSEQDSAAAQQYSRQGCPTGLRAQLWSLILNTTNDPEDITHYEQLKARVINHDLLVDNLIYKDVKLTASNDDYYFVFEDYLYQFYHKIIRSCRMLNDSSGSEQCAMVYPPNGVIPFHGFSMYVAPLCFLYNEPSTLYRVFREMYIRYLFRLHSVSSHPSGIVSLCLQFERLLQTHLPQLFYHLREIGAQPALLNKKVLAAAVFAFRAENLMEVTSLASAEVVTCVCVYKKYQNSVFTYSQHK